MSVTTLESPRAKTWYKRTFLFLCILSLGLIAAIGFRQHRATARFEERISRLTRAYVGTTIQIDAVRPNVMQWQLWVLNDGNDVVEDITTKYSILIGSMTPEGMIAGCPGVVPNGPFSILPHNNNKILVRILERDTIADVVQGRKRLIFCGTGSYSYAGETKSLSFCQVYRRCFGNFGECSDVLNNPGNQEPCYLNER